jgi:prepilin-type N-terminal cleavage/methylation domain-containing protein
MQTTKKTHAISEGFTLVELLVVVALLGITFGVTSDILISLVRSNTKAQIAGGIEQQSNFVSLKLEKDLRNASDVTWTLEESGKIIITRGGTGEQVTYEQKTNADNIGYIEITDGTKGPYQITDITSPGGVSVTCGQCFTVSEGSPKIVSINMVFDAVSGGALPVNFNDTIVIRSTY